MDEPLAVGEILRREGVARYAPILQSELSLP